ncbi:hypothetical protein HDU79_004788 [Rhizoclosmatium sp. JEL0117]|nr:hypothetical protein HDU79_004788 [Rhizoclosmatium sp. JEL0117]
MSQPQTYAPSSTSNYPQSQPRQPQVQPNEYPPTQPQLVQQSAHDAGLGLLLSAAGYSASAPNDVLIEGRSGPSQSGGSITVNTDHFHESPALSRNRSVANSSVSESLRVHPYRRPNQGHNLIQSSQKPDSVHVQQPQQPSAESIMNPNHHQPPAFLASPTAAGPTDTSETIMGDAAHASFAASPVAGDDDDCEVFQNAPVHQKQLSSNNSLYARQLPPPPRQPRLSAAVPLRIPSIAVAQSASLRMDSDGVGREPPQCISGPDVNPPNALSQSDPEKVQDAKDLAAFAAWVTLRLIGRRWSLLMEQKTAGGGAGVSGVGSVGGAMGTSSLHMSGGGGLIVGQQQVGTSFAVPAPGNSVNTVNGTGFSVFANTIQPSAYQAASISGYVPGTVQPQPLPPASVLTHNAQMASGPSGPGRPLLNRFQAPQQRIHSGLGYREDRFDSVTTVNNGSVAQSSGLSVYGTNGGSVMLPSLTVSQDATGRSDSVVGQVSSFGLKEHPEGLLNSPSQGSPIMARSGGQQQQYASSPLATHPGPVVLPSISQMIPQHQLSSSISSASTFVAPQPYSQQRSYHNSPHLSSPNHNNPQKLQQHPQLPQQQTKHMLPPAYISHYTSRLTRLSTLTLLKTPTPPHTTLLALHLLRRLISTPKPLPTRISTPTRMLLGCLMVADTLFGGERGVPSRVWSAIAQVSGLREGSEDVGGEEEEVVVGSVDAGQRLGFVAAIKKDVLVSLGFNLHGSVEGYHEWLGTLKDLLKEDGNAGGAAGAGGDVGGASLDMKNRTRRILDDLTVGEGRLAGGWKW